MSRLLVLISLLPLVTACQLGNAGVGSLPTAEPSQPTTKNTTAAPPIAQAGSRTARRTLIQVSDLPKPYASNSVSRSPRVIPQPSNARLQAPAGFKVNLFAQGLSRPRWLLSGPNGDIFLAESYDNRIRLLRDTNGDGVVDQNTVFAQGLRQPLGMAISPDNRFFYIANTDAVVRYPYQLGQSRLQGQAQTITRLPGGGYNQHWTRNLIFSPDGSKLFVSVGSQGNAAEEPLPRASIQVMNPDGSNRQTYASGLRNPVGLGFNPSTGKLFTTVNERDQLGDDLVPDYLTSVQPGGFYGWPYSYLGANPDPRLPRRAELERKAIVPDVLFQAHSAALGLTFYGGEQFPAEYRGDAFVAFRGSWNRSEGTGYKVVRVAFNAQGQPEGGYEDFLTGWLVNPSVPSVWGRPVGLTVSSDGALLVTDEPGGKIWRVTYVP
ncbi:sorbosone dehydrogenase family protein [Leptolyngbya sp. FACHB-261]|uniref:PQQ-dependent sugar dehydrogenase n=1 Tax=Leptolyngbya sp. FACHB-261 TaxID=2692806 RepID=UPI001688D995|nr:sorbosone dehydrogenase family protein [Leptolyngbya sp. FACHB-261]MBD2104667.1 sorbosone dehydrogenase family protein [Leptolyngbya sp. FACHB-261]